MKQRTEKTNREKTQELVMIALFTALTFVCTWLINIRLPFVGSGGLIHLGNVPLFIGAMLFGKKLGGVSGAVGMGLFDLLSGWTAWAPFTFVIVGLMGITVGWFAEKQPLKNRTVNSVVSLVLALIIKIVGYYIAEIIITGNWLAPVGSIPGNILQVGTAAIIAMVVTPQLARVCRGSALCTR